LAIQANQENLVALTTVMFNAAPGADNLGRFMNYATLEPLATDLASSETFKSQFAGLETLEDKIDLVLTHNLGMQRGSDAYEGGMSFFSARLESGVDAGSALLEAGTYLLGDNVDPKYADITQTLENKIEVGTYHSVEQGLSSGELSELQGVVDSVTSDPVSVEEAKAAIDDAAAGQILEVPYSEGVSTSYDAADLEGYEAVRFSGFDDIDQQINLSGVDDKQVLVENSAVTLNLNGMSAGNVQLANSDVRLYGDTQGENYTPTGLLKTLGVTVTTASSLELGESAAAGLTNLTLGGDGALNLSGNALDEGASLDASNMTGGLVVEGDVLDDAANVMAGSGDDELTVGALGTVDETDYSSAPGISIDGGAGNDTLTVTDSMTVDQVLDDNDEDINSGATVSADVRNVETVAFEEYVEVDSQDFSGTGNFVFAGGGSISNVGDQTITASSGSVDPEGSPLILRDAGETVNVVTTFESSDETLDLRVYDDSVEGTGTGGTLNLAGSGAVAYAEAGRQFDNIDSSELDGGLTFTGADYVQENIALGAGADTLNVAGNSIVGSDGDKMDSITGFDAGSDTLDIGPLDSLVGANVADATSLSDAFDIAATTSAGNENGYVTFEFDDSLYVYADSESAPGVNGEPGTEGVSYNDFAVKLVGLQQGQSAATGAIDESQV